MTTTAAFDAPFFRSLRDLGHDIFVDAVVRRAVRGDRASVSNALDVIGEEGNLRQLLWQSPADVQVFGHDAKGFEDKLPLKHMSILQAVALSLARDTMADDAKLSWVDITDIEGTKSNGAVVRTNHWEWRDDRASLLNKAILLCAEQSSLLDSKRAAHPVGRLFDALVDRVDFRGAFEQFQREAPIAMTFTIDLISNESATSLIRKGNIRMATLAIDMVGLESKEIEGLQRWLRTDADKGSAIFEGLLGGAHKARVEQPQHTGLLEEEADVLELVCKIADRDPLHAGDQLLRISTGMLQISEARKTQPSVQLIEALLDEHERRQNLTPGQPWSLEPPPSSPLDPGAADRNNRPRGIVDSYQVSQLLERAIGQRCATAVERLQKQLEQHFDASIYTTAWSSLPPEVEIDAEQFRRTSACLFEAGAPKDTFVVKIPSRGKDHTSSALHLVAQTQHPQAFDLMVALMEFGCDPYAPDHRNRKAGSYLEEDDRKRWEDVARSVKARSAAMDALREEFAPARMAAP